MANKMKYVLERDKSTVCVIKACQRQILEGTEALEVTEGLSECAQVAITRSIKRSVQRVELYNELSDVTMPDLRTVVNLTRLLEGDSIATYVKDEVHYRTLKKFPDRAAAILGATDGWRLGDLVIGSFHNELMSAIKRDKGSEENN